MKKSLNRKLSSALSLILAFALMIGAVPLTVFAQNSGQGTSTPALDKTINYVSLGDSMTNGYGLYGYHGNTGVEDYGNDSYANQFAKWLAMDGATVSHAQLAMSAMRAEDLHWLLEVDYDDPAVKAVIAELNAKENYYKNYDNIEKFNEVWYSVFTTGDYWTWDQMVNDYRFDVAAYCIEGKDKTDDGIFNEGSDEYPAGYKVAYKKYTDVEALQIVAKYYQTSVKEADVISLGIGNGNFGVFMFGRILEAIDFDGAPKDAMIYDVENAIRECDPELQDQLRKLMAEADAILASKGFVADDGDDTTVSTMEALYNTFMYATISYALNYAGTVEAILQLNPDAEIIQVALMNTMLDNTAVTDEVTLGDVMDLLFKPLNVYIAALPTYMQGTQNSVYADATFYWAEAPFVECIVDTYDDGPLNEIVRDRFYQAIVKDENGKIGMVWELLRDVVVPVTLAQIEAYEDLEDADKVAFAVASTSNTELAMSISMYLAFEKAIIAGKNTPVTIDSVMGVADLFADDADPFGSIMDDFYAAAAVAGKAQYQTVANVLAQGDADEATLIMVLLGDEEAVKTLASSLVDWANISGTHKSIEEILDCEKEMCGFGCEEARAAYADLKANPVYGVIALQSSGALTGAEVKTLYETDDWTTAATEVVAGRSEGQLTAKQVMALYTAVKDMDATARQNVYIYEVAKAINGGNIEDPDFSQVKNVVVEAVDAGDYGNADQKAIKAQVDGLAAAVTGVETIISMQGTIERGVDSANGIATGAQRLCTLLVMPAELSKSVAKSELSGLLALFARCVIGNGIGSHPSENGHNALFEAVKKAHEEEYTAQDQTIANIIYYVSEYYDEAYAYGYQYAVENGYVADAMEAIRVAGKEVRALKELVDSSELSDELKAELNEEIKLIDLVLFDIWTILENDEADELDEDALNALVDLLGKLNTAVANLADVAEVAASDAADAAAVELAKLVEALEEKWTNEWKPALENTAKVIAEAAYEYIVEALGDAYDYLVEAITDAVVEYFPVAADAVYNYLYNNPEEVIEFVKTYGPYVVDVMKEYGDEALAVLGYVLYTYGEDIAAYVVENADKILSALVSWIEVHGENTAALLQVYAEALGLCDAVREQIKLLEDELEKLEDALNAKIDEITKEIADLKVQLETAVGEAKAAIEAKIAELEAELAALKAEVEAKIAEVKAAIAELKAELKAAIESGLTKVENLKDAIANLDDKVAQLIETAKNAVLDQVGDAIKGVEDALAKLDDAIYDLAGEVYEDLKAALKELASDVAEEIVDAVKKYFPELADAVYDYLFNNSEEVIEFVKTYGPYLLEIAEKYSEEALAVVGYVLYTYGEDIAAYVVENADKILSALVSWIEVHGENTAALLQVYAEALGLCDAVRDQIAELEETLDELYATLETAIGELKGAIEAEIAKVEAAIAELKAELEAVVDEINAIIADVKATVEAAVANVKAAVAELKAAVAEAKAAIEELKAELREAINDAIDSAVEAVIAELEALLDQQLETLDDVVDALEAAAMNAAEEIKAIVDRLVYDATHADYEINKDSYYVAFGDDTAVSESYVDLLAKELGIDYNNLAKTGMTVDQVYDLIAEYEAEVLKADLITLGFGNVTFLNETINQVLMKETDPDLDWSLFVGEEGVPYVEDALAEIYAQFVEAGIDGTALGIDNMPEVMTAAVEAYVYSCVEYAATMPKVVNAIHALNPEALVIVVGMYNPMDEVVINLGTSTLEVGDYVDYLVDAAGLHGLVYAILSGNATYVDAPTVETLLTDKELDLLDIMREFVWHQGANLAPSEAGHEYIKDQILNALNVTKVGLLGDADSDGDVDNIDSMLILQYFTEEITADELDLSVCDVDGDGVINNIDSMLVLQYFTKEITAFPVA